MSTLITLAILVYAYLSLSSLSRISKDLKVLHTDMMRSANSHQYGKDEHVFQQQLQSLDTRIQSHLIGRWFFADIIRMSWNIHELNRANETATR